VGHHVVRVERIHGRHPVQAAPADIISRSVVLNVHRTKIPDQKIIQISQKIETNIYFLYFIGKI